MITTRQNETTGERPLPASDELFDEAADQIFWSKLTSFQNRFRLMCNARALSDCTLIIIEPTVDYGFHGRFHEIREFRRVL